MSSSKKKLAELSENESKLFDKLLEGTFEEVQGLLKEKDVRVDCLDKTGMTPLQHAAFRGKKELCELFLAHGADVNSNYHDNNYSTLMFAALSGNVEVTRMMLQAGANIHQVNSVKKTATQMAAFVGQHQCVSAINNFFPRSELEYYTKPQGLEKEGKLPLEALEPLLGLVNSVNLHPVKISMYLSNNMILVNESYKVCKVLDILVEKNMKARDTNDVMAVKLHYFATIIRLARKSHDEKNDNLKFWIKSLVKGRDTDGFPEFAERVVRQSLKEFPYIDSQLFQTLVRQISSVQIGDTPTALSSLIAGVNGNQFAMDEDICSTCGERNSIKSCSVCKYLQYCGQPCQKLHWATHKKFCKTLAQVYKRNQEKMAEEKAKEEELEKMRVEEAKNKKEAEDLGKGLNDVRLEDGKEKLADNNSNTANDIKPLTSDCQKTPTPSDSS